MKYAVIQTSGKQYKVKEGDTILIDRVKQESGSKIIFPQVLLIRTDNDIFVGKPVVEGGEVRGKVVSAVKGEKVISAKFKAKVRSRKKMGFRSSLSKVFIEKISIGESVGARKVKREKLLDRREKKQ